MTTVTYTFVDEQISDLHKDAYGYRPREGFFERWNSATNDEKQEEWDWLVAVLEQRIAEDRENERVAIIKFETAVDAIIACGAKTREDALRWLMDVSKCNGDWDYFAWDNGLPYTYFKK